MRRAVLPAAAALGVSAGALLAHRNWQNRETWRPTEYGSYQVSSHGRVRREGGRTLKAFDHPGGYQQVNLSVAGDVHRRYVHDLVASAYLGDRPSGDIINHLDGDKKHNRAKNLEYASISENALHAYRLGLQSPKKGEMHPGAKLTQENVHEIRHRYTSGSSLSELAREYGVSPQTVADVARSRTWA